MKLSSLAREFVKNQVTEAFAPRIRDAEARYQKAEEVLAGKWKEFEAAYESQLAKANEAFDKFFRSYYPDYGTDKDKSEYFEFQIRTGYQTPDRVHFERMFCDRRLVEAHRKARQLVRDTRDAVEQAAAKALFEIEVHGRKDTLETIVNEVIREALKAPSKAE